MSCRDSEIDEIVRKVTGIRPNIGDTDGRCEKLHSHSIGNVLMVSPTYDFFLVEEGGRLNGLFRDHYPTIPGRPPPVFTHKGSGMEGLEYIEKNNVDLVIIFKEPSDMGVVELASRVKSFDPKLLVAVVGNDVKGLVNENDIDHVFTWNGDGKIFLDILQYIEDRIQLENNPDVKSEGRIILLIEDSVQHYSTYVHLIYDEIRDHLENILDEDLTEDQVITRHLRRPRLLMAGDFTQGELCVERYGKNLAGVISDLSDQEGQYSGLHLVMDIKKRFDIPVMIQSSDVLEEVPEDIGFFHKSSSRLEWELKRFLSEVLGPTELSWDTGDGKSVTIRCLTDLDRAVGRSQEAATEQMLKSEDLSKWCIARGENELARSFEELRTGKRGSFQDDMKRLLEAHRYRVYKNSILEFHRESFGPHVRLSRIGTGALGGKARGLVFMSKLLSRHMGPEMLRGLNITVPRTIVLSTEVFEKFLKQNSLDIEELINLPDERIAAKFIESSLPPTVLGDIRSFVRNTKKPLIVRSSGVLEDSLSQPFAGVYASMLLPNESWDTDFRFQDVCNAIKYVFASTYFEAARNYLRSTPKNLNDEKMAVILQEVTGKKRGKYFYPSISGVARSYNHYPSGGCVPECGVAYLALGLGKNIVEGGRSHCFCPEHPRRPMVPDIEDRVKHSQRHFFGLNLRSIYRMLDMDEETSLVRLDLEEAEKQGLLRCIASTYQDGRLYPGTAYEGTRVLDFSPLLSPGIIPLAKGLGLVLKVAKMALGYPVEIEFTVEFEDDKCREATMYILQMRSMVSRKVEACVDIGAYEEMDVLLYSNNSLGNGLMEDIRDVVYVKEDSFAAKESQRIAREVSTLNRKLMKRDRKYLLIGPGRWGSSDHWMGIPIRWGDIAGALAIVETEMGGRHIEPSQGSHFFHDLVSSETGYLIVDEKGTKVDLQWLGEQDIVEEGEFTRHVTTRTPLELRLDGREGKGIVIKGKTKNR